MPSERVADPVDRAVDAEPVEQVGGGVGGAGDVAGAVEGSLRPSPGGSTSTYRRPAGSSGTIGSQVWLSTNIDDHRTVGAPSPDRADVESSEPGGDVGWCARREPRRRCDAGCWRWLIGRSFLPEFGVSSTHVNILMLASVS